VIKDGAQPPFITLSPYHFITTAVCVPIVTVRCHSARHYLQPASAASGRMNHLPSGKNLFPAEGISKRFPFNQINPPPEEFP